MRWIHAHYQVKWFTCISFFCEIFDCFVGFMLGRPISDFVSITIGIPIMWFFMNIKSAIRIPISETMTFFGRCIGIPNRIFSFYICTRILRLFFVGKSTCSFPIYAQSYPFCDNTSLMVMATSRRLLIGRELLQLSETPLPSGNIPVSIMPRCGLLSGQLL